MFRHVKKLQYTVRVSEPNPGLANLLLEQFGGPQGEGLVEEAQELIDATEAGPVRDAGLIGAAQKVEHYEIATYGTLVAMAKKLGLDQAASLLAETLAEEKSLSDVYSAEKQITRALPKMARAASDETLKAAFKQHLEETQGQIDRLDQAVEAHEELRIKRMKCHALEISGMNPAAQ
ncbi:hypothetical protein CRX72_15815 [Pantoea sp. BRM17]|nr:hypothetical protein CRX72_15815 [Pantoea sp. BRM17]